MQINKSKRKLQVSNGHYLDFDQTARLLHSIATAEEDQKITMKYLEDDTGLPFRQVRNRISVARAMGLLPDRKIQLTLFGEVIVKYDPFFENRGSLEFVHYRAAGNSKNIIWFEAFNTLLNTEPPLEYTGWLKYFRTSLEGQYTVKSLKDHLPKEVRFLVEAYIENNFKKLELLILDRQKKIVKRRFLQPTPLMFCAILYHYSKTQQANLMQVEELLHSPGSPAVLFFMGEKVFTATIESLHDYGYLRYEGTHDLNQIRLKEEYSWQDFLTAHYQNSEPMPSN